MITAVFLAVVGGSSAASATVATHIATVQGGWADVAGADTGGSALIAAHTTSDYSTNEWSLLSWSSAGTQPVGMVRGGLLGSTGPRTAISPNGRFLVWSQGGCRRLSVVLVEAAARPAVRHVLSLPARYAGGNLEMIDVASNGRITALVATHRLDCGNSGGTPAGERYAVLTGTQASKALSEVASVPATVSTPTLGGPETSGAAAVSPDASTIVLCGFARFQARSATLIRVRNQGALEVKRVSSIISRATLSPGPTCAVAQSGAALMELNFGVRRNLLTAISGGRNPRVSRGMLVDPPSLPALNPSGTDAFGSALDGAPIIVNLRTFRVTHLPIPRGFPSGGAQIEYGGEQLGSPLSNGLYVWPTAHTVISNGGDRLSLLDTVTRRWTQPSIGRQTAGITLLDACSLGGERILLARHDETSGPGVHTLYLRMPGQRRLNEIQTAALGRIHSLSCTPGTPSVYVSTGQNPAFLYQIDGSSIDGSPWLAR